MFWTELQFTSGILLGLIPVSCIFHSRNNKFVIYNNLCKTTNVLLSFTENKTHTRHLCNVLLY